MVDVKEQQQTLEIFYTCGSDLKGLEVERRPREVHCIFDHVFVRENLACDDPIKVCAHCTCSTSSEVQGQYPLCSSCKAHGKFP